VEFAVKRSSIGVKAKPVLDFHLQIRKKESRTRDDDVKRQESTNREREREREREKVYNQQTQKDRLSKIERLKDEGSSRGVHEKGGLTSLFLDYRISF
jgi:hypothetical protein